MLLFKGQSKMRDNNAHNINNKQEFKTRELLFVLFVFGQQILKSLNIFLS